MIIFKLCFGDVIEFGSDRFYLASDAFQKGDYWYLKLKEISNEEAYKIKEKEIEQVIRQR